MNLPGLIFLLFQLFLQYYLKFLFLLLLLFGYWSHFLMILPGFLSVFSNVLTSPGNKLFSFDIASSILASKSFYFCLSNFLLQKNSNEKLLLLLLLFHLLFLFCFNSIFYNFEPFYYSFFTNNITSSFFRLINFSLSNSKCICRIFL